jgi:thioredoxin 1
MAGAHTLILDDGNFDTEVLKAAQPVLVDFSAEWCMPCQLLAPTIDELAAELQGKVKVGKVDIDKAVRTAAKYGVQQIPTVIIFNKGEPVDRMLGPRRKTDYVNALNTKAGAAIA